MTLNLYCAAIHSNGYAEGGGVYVKLTEREQECVRGLRNDLESFYYARNARVTKHLRTTGIKVFLDSGAHSADTIGAVIDINEYCTFIKQHEDLIRLDEGTPMIAVLDSIGDALLTYQNQCEMERQGVRPIPCFHQGEDIRYLEYYAANYEYIALGGLTGAHPKALQVWLDRCWDRHLVDGAGRAKVKVHGFGVTSIPLMHRYPWRSCDSSSWIQSASFGAIVTQYGAVQISTKSPFRHVRGQHYVNVTDLERECIIRVVEDQGFDIERMATRYEARAAYNIHAFNSLDINTEQFRIDMRELF